VASRIKSKNLKKYIVFISPQLDFSNLRTSQSILCSALVVCCFLVVSTRLGIASHAQPIDFSTFDLKTTQGKASFG